MTSQPIVVGLDLSKGSEAALVRAADLAERFHTRLHLVHAAPTVSAYPDEREPAPDVSEHALKERVRSFAERALGGPDVFDAVNPEIVIQHGEAAPDALIRYTEDADGGMVVLGTHGHRGVRRLLMGSVAEEVVQRARCLVLTVPNAAARTAPGPDAPVLVPVDFSDPNVAALATARLIADHFDAPVELVHVVEDPRPYPDFYRDVPGLLTMYDTVPVADPEVEDHLRRFVEREGGDVAGYHVRAGRPDREIGGLAGEIGAGMIVMATHGLTGLDHAILGSVTERTLRAAPCPVLSFHNVVTEEAG